MNSRDRVLCTLAHKEPDHVPLDIGGSDVTGIHRDAYSRLAGHLGFETEAPICEVIQQVALPEEALLQRLEVDVRAVFPGTPDTWEPTYRRLERRLRFTDEWGVEWAMPEPGGLYFDMIAHPLAECTTASEIHSFAAPDPSDPGRFRGLRERAERYAVGEQRAIVLMPPYGGMFESGFWLRGYTQFFLDLGRNPELVNAILDKTLEFRLAYWSRALEELGDLVDVVVEYDDLGSTTSTLVSPAMYRKYLKPRHKELYGYIKGHSHARLFLHSCGAIYPLIPDFIDAGVDILNPIQVSAVNMSDGRKLKKEFGRDIVFWGGGVNTQTTLPHGSPRDVREEVRSRITDFAPGGGYVFAAVHNIQPDVPVENMIAMLEAWKEYGTY